MVGLLKLCFGILLLHSAWAEVSSENTDVVPVDGHLADVSFSDESTNVVASDGPGAVATSYYYYSYYSYYRRRYSSYYSYYRRRYSYNSSSYYSYYRRRSYSSYYSYYRRRSYSYYRRRYASYYSYYRRRYSSNSSSYYSYYRRRSYSSYYSYYRRRSYYSYSSYYRRRSYYSYSSYYRRRSYYSYSSYYRRRSSYSYYSYYRRRSYYSYYRRRSYYSYTYYDYRRRYTVLTPTSSPAKWIQPDWSKLTKFTTGISLNVTDLRFGSSASYYQSPAQKVISTIHSFGLTGSVKADIFGEKLTVDLYGKVTAGQVSATMGFTLVFADGSASLKFNTSLGGMGVTAGSNYCLKAVYPTGYIPAGAFLKESLTVAKPVITFALNEKIGHEDSTYGGKNVARFSHDVFQSDGGTDYANESVDVLYDATPVHASVKYNNSVQQGNANLNFIDWTEASDVAAEHCSGTWADLETLPEATVPLLAYDEVMRHLQLAGLDDLSRAFPAQALPLFAPRLSDELAQLSEPESDSTWTAVLAVGALASVTFGVMLVLLFPRRQSSRFEPLLEN